MTQPVSTSQPTDVQSADVSFGPVDIARPDSYAKIYQSGENSRGVTMARCRVPLMFGDALLMTIPSNIGLIETEDVAEGVLRYAPRVSAPREPKLSAQMEQQYRAHVAAACRSWAGYANAVQLAQSALAGETIPKGKGAKAEPMLALPTGLATKPRLVKPGDKPAPTAPKKS